jgi:glycine/D-amino acid oxidase-like deaminating enzyme/nitrite reductase/ring-hydroxylating ferredoxin subunit
MLRLAGKHGSLWSLRSPRAHYPRLGRDLVVDVVIIGGGITGLTAAWLLKQAGKSVAVVELNEVGGGATGCSTGHLTVIPDHSLPRLTADFGEEGAKEVIRCGMEAIDFIESQSSPESAFERVPGFRFTEQHEKVDDLWKEAELAVRLGLPASYVRDLPVPFPACGGLRVENQAQFHPVRYLESLLERVAGDEGHVFEHTRVDSVEEGETCRVVAGSHAIQAEIVIEAAHTPINRALGVQSRLVPHMTYVLGLKLKDRTPRALLWDTSEPYHYLRGATTETGELLLVGGEDRKTGQDHDPVARLEALLEYARRRFPVESVEWSWSQQVFDSADGLPFIGKKPGHERILTSGGYSGAGLTFGTMAGIVLSQLAQGRETPASRLYSPSRIKPLAAAREFLRENLNVAWHLVADRLLTHRDADGQSLKPCQGKVMDLDGRQVAVYLDETRRLHVMSPVCSHAGGIVAWNDLEKTWDCPCHGGRYSPTGKVICSPPTHDLEVIPEPVRPSRTMVGP